MTKGDEGFACGSSVLQTHLGRSRRKTTRQTHQTISIYCVITSSYCNCVKSFHRCFTQLQTDTHQNHQNKAQRPRKQRAHSHTTLPPAPPRPPRPPGCVWPMRCSTRPITSTCRNLFVHSYLRPMAQGAGSDAVMDRAIATGRPSKPKVIIVTGPTAVGKTKIGLELAKRLGGEVISADSVQVYTGLDIGSDKVCRILGCCGAACGPSSRRQSMV